MKGRLVLSQPWRRPPLRLRGIGPEDLEDLRSWKNAHREAFFFKDSITPEAQRKWYEGYLERPNDCMFIVESGPLRAGCMAFRLEHDGAADFYNIIGSPEGRGQGLLKGGMMVLCSYVLVERSRRISLKVVSGNAARGFYESCGFERAEERETYVLMRLRAEFRSVRYEKEEAA